MRLGGILGGLEVSWMRLGSVLKAKSWFLGSIRRPGRVTCRKCDRGLFFWRSGSWEHTVWWRRNHCFLAYLPTRTSGCYKLHWHMMHLEAFKPTRTSGTKMIQTYMDFRTYKPISIEPKPSTAWWPRWGRRIIVHACTMIIIHAAYLMTHGTKCEYVIHIYIYIYI